MDELEVIAVDTVDRDTVATSPAPPSPGRSHAGWVASSGSWPCSSSGRSSDDLLRRPQRQHPAADRDPLPDRRPTGWPSTGATSRPRPVRRSGAGCGATPLAIVLAVRRSCRSRSSRRVCCELAVAAYCLPIIAIGPILQILFDGDDPEDHPGRPVVLLHHAHRGDRGAPERRPHVSLDLVTAYGGGSWTQHAQGAASRPACPALFAGLRIAAPAAVLGAIIGEYMGGDNGLGVAMINSQQALQHRAHLGHRVAVHRDRRHRLRRHRARRTPAHPVGPEEHHDDRRRHDRRRRRRSDHGRDPSPRGPDDRRSSPSGGGSAVRVETMLSRRRRHRGRTRGMGGDA